VDINDLPSAGSDPRCKSLVINSLTGLLHSPQILKIWNVSEDIEALESELQGKAIAMTNIQ
jgi:hypothetical protein